MMYLAWRFHGKFPNEIYWMPIGERRILYALIAREVEDRNEESNPGNEGGF